MKSVAEHAIVKCEVLQTTFSGGLATEFGHSETAGSPSSSDKTLRAKEKTLYSSSFEQTSVRFQIEHEIENTHLFVGDAHQFLNQHIEVPMGIQVISIEEIKDPRYILYKDMEYFGSFDSLEQIEELSPAQIRIKREQDGGWTSTEIDLPDEWGEVHSSPFKLTEWLLENSNLFTKGVVNFVPDSQVRRLRTESFLSMIREPTLKVSMILMVILFCFWLGSIALDRYTETTWQSTKPLREMEKAEATAEGKFNRNIEIYEEFIGFSKQRSNITEQIAQYESIIPPNVQLTELKVNVNPTSSTATHQIQCVAPNNDFVKTTLDALVAWDELESVSLKKVSSSKSGRIKFEIEAVLPR